MTPTNTLLKELRVRRGLNQEEIAEMLGISRSAYSTYENGRVPPIVVVQRIRQCFGEDGDDVVKHYLSQSAGSFPIKEKGTPVYENLLSSSEIPDHPNYYINNPRHQDCDIGCVQRGSSMSPLISSGDVVLCKSTLMDEVIYGDTYLVRMQSGAFLIRAVYPSESPEELQLMSATRALSSVIHKDGVTQLWRVSGVYKSL